MMRIVRTTGVLGLLLSMAASLWATDVTVALRRMTAALEPALDMTADVEFLIDNARGERVRWTGRYQRLSTPPIKRIVLETPEDLAGLAVVLEGGPAELRGMRIYLPFVRRTREIRGDMQGASFMGSDFNFEDLGFAELEFHQHTVRGEGMVFGRPCLRVDSVPDRKSWYGRISYCLDLKDWLPRRTEYFDRAGELYKVRTMVVERADGHQTPVRVTMEVLQEKTKTAMILTNVEYNVGLTPAMLKAEVRSRGRSRPADYEGHPEASKTNPQKGQPPFSPRKNPN